MRLRTLAALSLAVASLHAHAQILLAEGFDAVPGLGNWIILNNSRPAGVISEGWFQGDSTQFTAADGPDNSFAASNFAVAASGGAVDTWLITPLFSTDQPVDIVFYARASADPGFTDQLAYGWSTGGGLPGSFTMSTPVTVGGSGWTRYSLHLDAQGTGSMARFAINYTGPADTANYLGIDQLSVTAAAVPEPGQAALLAAGLLGVAASLRRRATP